jgi:hypothetical protein
VLRRASVKLHWPSEHKITNLPSCSRERQCLLRKSFRLIGNYFSIGWVSRVKIRRQLWDVEFCFGYWAYQFPLSLFFFWSSITKDTLLKHGPRKGPLLTVRRPDRSVTRSGNCSGHLRARWLSCVRHLTSRLLAQNGVCCSHQLGRDWGQSRRGWPAPKPPLLTHNGTHRSAQITLPGFVKLQPSRFKASSSRSAPSEQ